MSEEIRNHPMVEVLGSEARMAIMCSLIEADEPLRTNEVANQSGFTRITVYRHIDKLIQANLVKRNAYPHSFDDYVVNRDHPGVEYLREIKASMDPVPA